MRTRTLADTLNIARTLTRLLLAAGPWMAKSAFKSESGALSVTNYASALVEGERTLIAAGQGLLAARLEQRRVAGRVAAGAARA